MKVLRKHRTCFSRQVHESVLIEMAEKRKLLNSKNTFNRCSIPRLSIENSVNNNEVELKVKDIPEREIADMFEKRNRLKLKQRRPDHNSNFNWDHPSKRRKYFVEDSFSNASVCKDKKVKNDSRVESEAGKQHDRWSSSPPFVFYFY